jgi:hypothetical protein
MEPQNCLVTYRDKVEPKNENTHTYIKSECLVAMAMKITTFQDVKLCSLVGLLTLVLKSSVP